MTENKQKNSILQEIFLGISFALLSGSCALCMGASVGLGALSVLLAVLVAVFLSLVCKNAVFYPDIFLFAAITPLFVQRENPAEFISTFLLGILIYGLLKKLEIPRIVKAAVGLGLALCVTVYCTNLYFGIGVMGNTPTEIMENLKIFSDNGEFSSIFGFTPFNMIESYRYLGFHPDFRGLLFGTITLFAMITYPFKFKKLNKKLPAQFFTLALPLIFNLILNPDADTSASIEISAFTFERTHSLMGSFAHISTFEECLPHIDTALTLGIIMKIFGTSDDSLRRPLMTANAAQSLLSFCPLRAENSADFGVAASISATVFSVAAFGLGYPIIARVPIYSVGALLIVWAWQTVPYKHLSAAFRESKITSLFFITTIPLCFIFFGLTGGAIAALCGALSHKTSKEVGANG